MPSNERPTGDQIRMARQRLRMRQRDLAERLDVTTKTVGRWERGEHIPRTHVEDLQAVLQIPTVADRPEHPDEAALDDATIEAALRQASHLQVLAELARRIQAGQDPDRDLPTVPQVHLRWPKTAAPSASDTGPDEPHVNDTGA